MRVILIALLFGILDFGHAVDFDDTCPKGQAAATKCQIKMQEAFDDAEDPVTTVSEGILRFCCGLGYSVDCLLYTAIPLCEKSEREILTEATNDYFKNMPQELFSRSCEDHYFVDRKVPAICEGVVDAPNLNDTVPMPPDDGDGFPVGAIVSGVIVIVAILAIVAGVLVARLRSRKKGSVTNVETVRVVRFSRYQKNDS